MWSQFQPAVGLERFHCDMKRGFYRARKKEPKVAERLDRESEAIRIGHWVQKGIYVFVKQPKFLESDRYFKVLLKKLVYRPDENSKICISQESLPVRFRVAKILQKYRQNPILHRHKIVELSSGEEGFPPAIPIQQGNFRFNLFAAFDGLIEIGETLCVLDLKTGKSPFDTRQAYVYLLALSKKYPDRKIAAFFHNVEQQITSELITATPQQLQAIQWRLVELAKLHQQQLREFKQNRDRFAEIYPPNPGKACRGCQFNDICKYSGFNA